ncbi:hypothetical protein LWF15_09200 [Kineosporia rhizophila]|uniref:hypothetical protein n=1 Tax=Kineosporia TaxID=49184 RepID=UPI001E2D37B5|nr:MULTISPECIES: hypothetical protein [Kineosporia]MCE0535688.1 hypothetical protein [Kineosporia rhizophila]GLY17666.1 hypothetical protein Kisp01_46800 [Kineosporia sp. NBRC 101677]
MSGISLSRTTVLTVVLLVEVAVVLFFVARWYSRRWGWKSTFGRIRRYLRATFADLVRPAVQVYRFGRNVRLIAAQLNDPELGGVLRTGLGDANARLAGEPDTRPFAALVSRTTLTLALSGLRRVEPGQGPWRMRENRWEANRQAVTPGPADLVDDVPAVPVVIGAENGTVTLLDLLRAPGVIEVTGPDRQVGSLICAVAAQLSARLVPAGSLEPDVVVASGLHPRFSGPQPLAVLRDLDARARTGNYQHPLTVLFCGPLNDTEADLLTAVAPGLPMLRVMIAGPYAGRRWKLPLDETGRVVAPELGLFTDSAPVERGVARALKKRASGGIPDRPVARPAAPAPSGPRPAAPPAPAPAPVVPAYLEEPEYEETPQYSYSPAQPEFEPQYQTTGGWERPEAPSAWDLDEPEPASPQTGGLSVSAVSARDQEDDRTSRP